MMKIFLFLSFLGCEGVSISKTTPITAYPSAASSAAGDWQSRDKWLPRWVTASAASNLPTANDKKFVWSEGVSDSIDTGDFKLDNFAKRSSQDATFDSRHQDRAKFQEQIGRNNADGSDNAGKKSWHHHQHFNDNKYGKILKGNARGATNTLHNEDRVDEDHSSIDFSQAGKENDNNDLLEFKVDGTAARHLNTSSVISKLGRKVITITAGNNSAGVVGEGTLLKNAGAGIASGYVALNPADATWGNQKKTKEYVNAHGVDTVEPIALEDTDNEGDRAVTSLATHLEDGDGNEFISKMDYIKHKYDAPACKSGDWEGTNGCIYRLGNDNTGVGACGTGVSVGDAVPLCTAQNGTPGSGGSATSCGICRAAGSGAAGELYAAKWFADA